MLVVPASLRLRTTSVVSATEEERLLTELVDLLSEIVAGRGAGLTAAQQAAIEAWVPTGFEPRSLERYPLKAPLITTRRPKPRKKAFLRKDASEPQSPDNDTTPQALSADNAETPAFLDN